MLAGVLETVAVYTVLRSKSLVDQTLPPEFSGNLLLTFGLLFDVVVASRSFSFSTTTSGSLPIQVSNIWGWP